MCTRGLIERTMSGVGVFIVRYFSGVIRGVGPGPGWDEIGNAILINTSRINKRHRPGDAVPTKRGKNEPVRS